MAPPVSCATISRRSGTVEPGEVVSTNTGAPSGTTRGSTARLRPPVSGMPSEPGGPASLSGSSRKNTYEGFSASKATSWSGLRAPQLLIPCIDA